MNKGITEYDKFRVLRPLDKEFKLDKMDMPIMKKIELSSLNFEQARPTNLQNISNEKDNIYKIVFPFNYDKVLDKYWNNPLKYIPLFQTVMGVGTPDYSLYPNMNTNAIRYNVYRNRWLGCLWQSYGINAIPTIGWALPDTYDICFSGIEKGSVVMISTIGCQLNATTFLRGYEEMLYRLEPSLIIVYGNMISGMTGTFVNYKLTDCFNVNSKNKKLVQMELFKMSPIFKIKEDYTNGI